MWFWEQSKLRQQNFLTSMQPATVSLNRLAKSSGRRREVFPDYGNFIVSFRKLPTGSMAAIPLPCPYIIAPSATKFNKKPKSHFSSAA
jgi:hypothetical protein